MNNYTNESWNELLKAFSSGLIDSDIMPEYEYRVYYNKQGQIIKTTALKTDLLDFDNYIIVNKEDYESISKFYVKNKILELKRSEFSQTYQLSPSKTGFKVVKNNPALLLEKNEKYVSTEYYNYRNN